MIGLFLGEKKLPLEILKSLKKKNIKYFIIDLSKNNKFKKIGTVILLILENLAKF